MTIRLSVADPAIKHLCKKDAKLKMVIELIGPITYQPFDDDPYAFLIHEIIEQMLSIKAGQKIYRNLLSLCDGKITPSRINDLSYEQIKSVGTSNAKVTYIQSVTRSVLNGEIDLESLKDKNENQVIKELTSLKGIGIWTAKMYLLFVLDRQDVLPIEDAAFLQSYKWLYKTDIIDKTSIEKRCHKWKPYSSIATRYLYKALDMGLTKDASNHA